MFRTDLKEELLSNAGMVDLGQVVVGSVGQIRRLLG